MNDRFTHGGNVYGGGAPLGGWHDFSANINPLGLAPSVRDAILSHVGDIIHYPDTTAKELRAAISSHYGVAADSIVLGNGAAELFYVLFHVMRPRRVLIPMPSFSEYERAALSAEAEIDWFTMSEENQFALDVDELIHIIETKNIDAVIFGNPNNPTGRLVKKGDVEKIAKVAAEYETLVIVDESFIDFRNDADEYTARELVSSHENLIVVESMTKFYAIPGLRLGFAIAPSVIGARMDEGKDPWNVNLLAQHAGVAALADTAYQEQARDVVAREKDALYEMLGALDGIEPFEPSVNFILLRLDKKLWGTSEKLCVKMKGKGFLIRDCANYVGLDERFVRVAVKTREENEALVDALKSIAQGNDKTIS